MDLEWALVTSWLYNTHCALVHSEEGITGTLQQTHPIQRRSFETALKNSEHSDGVNLLSFLSESEQKVVN